MKYFKEWIFCVNIVVINILFTIKVSTPFKGEAKDRIYMLIALILTFSQWEKENSGRCAFALLAHPVQHPADQEQHR